MKIAIFGGAGYVGSALTRHLTAAGHTVIVLDKLIHNQPSPHGVVVSFGDICDVKPEWLEGAEIVYNLAALVSEWVCRERPDDARRVNVDGAVRLAEVAVAAGVKRYIFASTASVYDGSRCGNRLREDEAQSLGIYGQTKLAAELHLTVFANRLDLVILRKGTVFGFGTAPNTTTRPRYDLAVQMMLRDAVRAGVIHVHGGGTVWRPWLGLGDAVRAYEQALTLMPGIYNAAGENLRVYDVAEEIAAVSEHLCPKHVHVRYECAGGDGRDYRVNSERMLATGWDPTETIGAFAASFFKNPPTEEDMMNPAWYNLGRVT